jgi:hypothetical protein
MGEPPQQPPLWAKYQPPTVETVAEDLQRLRRDGQLTPKAVARRYVLTHLPIGLAIDDLRRRAELLADAIREAIQHNLLTEEQRIIAPWSFAPPAAFAQRSLRDRLEQAALELDQRFPVDRWGEPQEWSLKRVQDREDALISTVAGLLLDSDFASSFLSRHEITVPVQPPADPYAPFGYEWVASEHELRFDAEDLQLHHLRYKIEIKAVRRGQRLFTLRHAWAGQGVEFPVRVLSEQEGHRLLERVPDPRPDNPSAHILYFYLGRALELGEPTVLEFTRDFRETSSPEHHFAMEMDDAPQERLTLRVFLPKEMCCHAWTRELWSDSSTNSRRLEREVFPITPGEDTLAEYDVHPEPWRYYRIVWWKSGQEIDP